MTPRSTEAATQKPIRMRSPFSLSAGMMFLKKLMSMAHLPRRNRINATEAPPVKGGRRSAPAEAEDACGHLFHIIGPRPRAAASGQKKAPGQYMAGGNLLEIDSRGA